MIDTPHPSPYGVLVLRVTLGAFFFIHGAIKLSRYVSGRTRAWLKTKNPDFERR